ncbi:DUF2786 domain-containing protein [Streptomyces sp. NPDC001508]|uniref:DUF2786 domain-containing protein n=1 Tax=Streptomyces sp. NPDC001508 TaxID=3154656 RepID=UPI00331BF30F
MGKRNQERRRAKKKQRDARQRARTGQEQGFGAAFGSGFGGCTCGDPFCEAGVSGTSVPRPRGPLSVTDLLNEAMERVCAVPLDDTARREAALERAAALFTKAGMGRAVLAAGSEVLHTVWHRGWQPADVVRAARRELKARHGRIAADLVAAEQRAYPAAGLDERWAAQLATLPAEVWWSDDDTYLTGAAAREKCEPTVLGRAWVELLDLLSGLPEIPLLMPPPCEAASPAASGSGGTQAPVLAKVRGLLAKAESTEFTEEAEALTAKAQQLMAQHSIDAALLDAQQETRQAPGGVRVGVDAPYEEPKVHLLQAVAEANRCRTVWSRNLGFATVVGFASDARAVELLYTSLLVQAQSALQAAGSRTHRDGASRTRSYRQSFLTAYATRIAQRLSRATEQATKAAGKDHGPGLLPVLASRAQAVNDQVDGWFTELSYNLSQTRAQDREGWSHGTVAANRAQLHGPADALR